MEFRDILKDLRFEKNVTQGVVAKSCGLTPTCICQLEAGARNPTGSTIIALAKYFDVSADYLLGLEDDFGARTDTTVEAVTGYSLEEKNLIENYRELNQSGKRLINETIKTLLTASAGSERELNG